MTISKLMFPGVRVDKSNLAYTLSGAALCVALQSGSRSWASRVGIPTGKKARGLCAFDAWKMALLRQSAGTVAALSKTVRAHHCAPVNVKLDLSGIFPPITTPFNDDESVAFDKLTENLKKWEKFPFKGYVVQGSNGEYPLMTMDERLEMVKRVRQQVSNSKLVIAGSSCESTQHTVELTKAMAEAGADAVMVINPSYFKSSMTFDALLAHYERVADESPVPVVVYNMPANTGIDLNAALLGRLAKHPNIVGVKDSGGDITKMARVALETRELGFQVIAGSTGFLLPAMLVGCVGGINGLANILCEEVCQLYSLAAEGRYHEAVSLHQKLVIPNSLVTRELGVPAMKAAMDSVGLYGGPCRRPLMPLTAVEVQKVKDAFAKSGCPLAGQLNK